MDDQLGKLIEPKPVPFTFTAPGWYVVGGLIVLLLIGLVWLLIRQYQLNRYRKHALLLLANTEKKYTDEQAFDLLIYEADLLIKRIAMSRYGRQNVSGLRDGQWTAFINRTWHEKSFNEQDEVLLNQTIYQSKQVVTADEAQAFTQKAKRWIKKHKRHINAV
ncbi:DUF4381 domain-containing protein [Mucilaginibacter jinjuensis]|uniref:DUF4381 domain-containing protein n=1 Tax=Mucilaginibacter jinjuensis TaxID=1176721 RepID=A0ABY7T0L2_9SPHI|nr:DUF4381 domain-containing protein [Mucilaginibacter jinjuensis]WCT09975.1 DUF4381 domain-containing protein [Mucilaginibacter jinjuensis]